MLQNHTTAKAAIYARRSPEDRANRQNQFRGDGVSDSIESQLKMFFKQGWKLIIITILVMTGTFFGSLAVAQAVLQLTHAI